MSSFVAGTESSASRFISLPFFEAYVKLIKPPIMFNSRPSNFRTWTRKTQLSALNKLASLVVACWSKTRFREPREAPSWNNRTEEPLPRTIWIFWHSGEIDAPPLVALSIESWRRLNSSWKVRVLDKDSARDLCNLDYIPSTVGIANYSDCLRLQLLAQYGGVWADASTLCARPLDEWIDHCTSAGFFAFRNPGPDRLLSTWFLASNPGNPLVLEWEHSLRTYWTRRRYAVHYFVAHYIFEWNLVCNPDLRRWWRRVPVRQAVPPHLLSQRLAQNPQCTEGMFDVPVHKLNRRCEVDIPTLHAALFV